MKNSKIVLLLTTAFILCFSSCQDDLVPFPDNDVVQFSEDEDELLKCGRIKRTVPFRGRYETYPQFIEVTQDGGTKFSIPSEGFATYLGRSTWNSISVVYNSNNQVPPWHQIGEDMVFEQNRTGDKLIGSFVGESNSNDENPFFGWGEYEITSGTGKFKGVTGSGTYSYALTNDMVGDLTFIGTLTFPGRKRHGR